MIVSAPAAMGLNNVAGVWIPPSAITGTSYPEGVCNIPEGIKLGQTHSCYNAGCTNWPGANTHFNRIAPASANILACVGGEAMFPTLPQAWGIPS
jgi:hypothetical protein